MYGENSAALRSALTILLKQHRIQQRIGGASLHTVPVPNSVEQREVIGHLIQRYRYGVLTWCQQALTAADPRMHGSDASELELDLRQRLDAARRSSTASLPSLTDLTSRQNFSLVDVWRRAARAAALGEHDLVGEITHDLASPDECLTVIKDAAAIIHGLVVLDHRYSNIPGWERLQGREALARAAERCATLHASDYRVDQRGWRPRASTIDGPALPGIAGVIQAEHNLLTHLTEFPTALNLRRILNSQREISHLLANRVATTAPELACEWTQRAERYTALQREARNIGGTVGSGGAAVAEAANAASRLRGLHRTPRPTDHALTELGVLFAHIDQRVLGIVEHGAREHLYFARAQMPRIVENDGNLVHGVRERFMPITTPIRSDLIRLARELPLSTRTPDPQAAARASRLDLEAAIRHRPPRRPTRGLEL